MPQLNKIFLLIAAVTITACTPTVVKRGNMLEDFQLKQVQAGVSTRSDVLRNFGSPTTTAPFNDNAWYYIGQETEKKGILDPKIVKERIFEVSFGQDGIVQAVRELPKGAGLDIPIAREKTVTYGNEVTVMQQMLGNIGKFNKAGSQKNDGIGAPNR
jgi:outer membrane protein assembly factor BamE (lipoprotein component of BamABCDE complex)